LIDILDVMIRMSVAMNHKVTTPNQASRIDDAIYTFGRRWSPSPFDVLYHNHLSHQ
jgi:hypothetical protein